MSARVDTIIKSLTSDNHVTIESLVGVALCVLAMIFVSAMVSFAQNTCLDRTISVNVYDERGVPVRDLSAANFQGKLHGQPVTITSATYDVGPRRIVILLDVSGSMVKDVSDYALKSSTMFARELVGSARPDTSFALLTFTSQIEDRVAFDQDRGPAEGELLKVATANWEKVKGLRKTAIRDAVMEGLHDFGPPQLGDTICLITDGGDNVSGEREADLRRALLASAIRVFPILVSRPSTNRGRTPETDGLGQMQGLGEYTGGRLVTLAGGRSPVWGYSPPAVWHATDQERQSIQQAARAVDAAVSELYKLTIRLPGPLNKDHSWSLEVVDASGQKKKDTSAIYPKELAACN